MTALFCADMLLRGSFGSSVLSLLWMAATLVFLYMIFSKMNLIPWKGLVPGYNLFELCREFDGNGFRVFLFLIPVYGVILWVKLCMKWARSFGKTNGFGVGMAFLTPIFLGILAFDEKVCYAKSVIL